MRTLFDVDFKSYICMHKNTVFVIFLFSCRSHACVTISMSGLYLSISYLSVCLVSAWTSFCLSICPSVCLSACHVSVRLSACLSLHLSLLYLSVCRSACLSVCLYVRHYVSLTLFIRLSVWLFVIDFLSLSLYLSFSLIVFTFLNSLNFRKRYYSKILKSGCLKKKLISV